MKNNILTFARNFSPLNLQGDETLFNNINNDNYKTRKTFIRREYQTNIVEDRERFLYFLNLLDEAMGDIPLMPFGALSSWLHLNKESFIRIESELGIRILILSLKISFEKKMFSYLSDMDDILADINRFVDGTNIKKFIFLGYTATRTQEDIIFWAKNIYSDYPVDFFGESSKAMWMDARSMHFMPISSLTTFSEMDVSIKNIISNRFGTSTENVLEINELINSISKVYISTFGGHVSLALLKWAGSYEKIEEWRLQI